jgi:hypothetical protein
MVRDFQSRGDAIQSTLLAFAEAFGGHVHDGCRPSYCIMKFYGESCDFNACGVLIESHMFLLAWICVVLWIIHCQVILMTERPWRAAVTSAFNVSSRWVAVILALWFMGSNLELSRANSSSYKFVPSLIVYLYSIFEENLEIFLFSPYAYFLSKATLKIFLLLGWYSLWHFAKFSIKMLRYATCSLYGLIEFGSPIGEIVSAFVLRRFHCVLDAFIDPAAAVGRRLRRKTDFGRDLVDYQRFLLSGFWRLFDDSVLEHELSDIISSIMGGPPAPHGGDLMCRRPEDFYKLQRATYSAFELAYLARGHDVPFEVVMRTAMQDKDTLRHSLALVFSHGFKVSVWARSQIVFHALVFRDGEICFNDFKCLLFLRFEAPNAHADLKVRATREGKGKTKGNTQESRMVRAKRSLRVAHGRDGMLSRLSDAAMVIYDHILEGVGDDELAILERMRDLDNEIEDNRDKLDHGRTVLSDERRAQIEGELAAGESALENLAGRILRNRGMRNLPEFGDRYGALLKDLDEDDQPDYYGHEQYDREDDFANFCRGRRPVREAGGRSPGDMRSMEFAPKRCDDPLVVAAIDELLKDCPPQNRGLEPSAIIDKLRCVLDIAPEKAIVRESKTSVNPVQRNMGSVVCDGDARANLIKCGSTVFLYLQDHVRSNMPDPSKFCVRRFNLEVDLSESTLVVDDIRRYEIKEPPPSVFDWALTLSGLRSKMSELYLLRSPVVVETIVDPDRDSLSVGKREFDVLSYKNSTLDGDCGCAIVDDRGHIVAIHGYGGNKKNYGVLLIQTKKAETMVQQAGGLETASESKRKRNRRQKREGVNLFGGVHCDPHSKITMPREGAKVFGGVRVKPGFNDCKREVMRFNTPKVYSVPFKEAFLDEMSKLGVEQNLHGDVPDILTRDGYIRLLTKFKTLDVKASSGFPWQCVGEVDFVTTKLDEKVTITVGGNNTLYDLIQVVGSALEDDGERRIASGVQGLIFHFYHWYFHHIRGGDGIPSDEIKYIVFGKNDFYKLEKLEKGVVRTIQACDWRLKLLWSYYFDEVNDLWAHDFDNGQVVAVNPRSNDWSSVMLPLINDEWGSKSFDLTGNDRDMPAFCIEAFFELYLKRCISSPNKDLDAVLKLFSDTTTRTDMVLGHTLIRKSDGLPSGMPNTIMVNTVVRLCAARAILKVKGWTHRARHIRACGDDLIMSTTIPPDEWIAAVGEHTPWVEKLESEAPTGQLAHFVSLRTVPIYRRGQMFLRPAPVSVRKNVLNFLSRAPDDLDDERIMGLFTHHAVTAVFLRQNCDGVLGMAAFELFHNEMHRAYTHYRGELSYDDLMYWVEECYIATLPRRQARTRCDVFNCTGAAVGCCGHMVVCAAHGLRQGLSVWDDEYNCSEFENFPGSTRFCDIHGGPITHHRIGQCHYCGEGAAPDTLKKFLIDFMLTNSMNVPDAPNCLKKQIVAEAERRRMICRLPKSRPCECGRYAAYCCMHSAYCRDCVGNLRCEECDEDLDDEDWAEKYTPEEARDRLLGHRHPLGGRRCCGALIVGSQPPALNGAGGSYH